METNILWLSDIHYKWVHKECEYEKNGNVKKIVSDFIAFLQENFNNKIDKIILTGDISFSGSAYEYDHFNKNVLEKIVTTQKSVNPKIIPIPGNHDIQWEGIKKKIKTFDTDKIINHFKDEKLRDDNYFESVLQNYSIKIGEEYLKKYSTYNNCKCNGFFYDGESNILFILINSAVNSYGQVVNEIVESEFKDRFKFIDRKDYFFENSQKIIEKTMSINGEILPQKGRQTYSYSNDLHKEIVSYIKEKQINPFIITLAHHPPDWLFWNERFSFSTNDKPNAVKELLDLSSILCVGHEHSVPIYEKVGAGDCVMLRSGMFMDSSVENINEKNNAKIFPNNWFSILTINDNNIKFRNFKYEGDSGFLWNEKPEFSYPFEIRDNKLVAKMVNNSVVELEEPNFKIILEKELVADELINFFKKKTSKEFIEEKLDLDIKNMSVLFLKEKMKDQFKIVLSPLKDSKLPEFADQILTLLEDIRVFIENKYDNINLNSENTVVSIIQFYLASRVSDVTLGENFRIKEVEFVSLKHKLFNGMLKRSELFEKFSGLKVTFHLIEK